jgi:hypothetical protein
VVAAASEAGLSASSIPTLLVEGEDKPGVRDYRDHLVLQGGSELHVLNSYVKPPYA